jgi:3-mercaptopyruvate sulfurtransferase SseA
LRFLISGLSLASLTGAILLSCSDPNNDPGVIGRAGTSSKGNDGGSGGETGGAGGDELGGTSAAGTSNLAGLGGVDPGAAGGGGVAGAAENGGAGAEPGAGAGAGGSGEGGADTGLHVSTPGELPDESAADYADNLHGLITGDTLDSWVESWTTNRPVGVTGKLVVLQVVPSAAASLVHVASNANVASYLVSSSELTQVRDNGLSKIEAEIPDGASADAFLKKYGIDAVNDYVVLTFEQLASTQSSIVQSVGRAWLLLRYWGYPKERLGLLNGSVNWNATAHGLATSAAAATPPPGDGESSVKDLLVDNTAFVIPLSSLLDIYHGSPGATPLANVSLIDARGGAEALGLLKATSTGKTDCQSYTGTGTNSRCSPPFEGRLKGASSVPWPQFLDTSANGFQFFSKAAVKAAFDTQSGYEAGQLTIQYCRTNMRSMVTGIVANVILGYPTRFYDTSFIEWSHLAYGPTPLTRVLPENSSFRTDLASLTEHADVSGYTPGGSIEGITINGWVEGPNYNADADISPTLPQVTPTATSTTLSVQTDKAYKQ